MTSTISMTEFAAVNHITMTSERADSNPNMDDSRNMDHWRVTLRRTRGDARKTMTLIFSKGIGHGGSSPEVEDVLDCLASDSSCIGDSFEDWCSDMGFDPDSRKAEKIYKTCERQAKRLESFLGSGLYQDLLWNTERL